ncbi:DUF1127 domain-containing protein [Hoeflea olei]|uniref:YjiS-like domain-containing protein n=1 Tax=Hoeflea olei TaxID=1480615 RepID=A0A1C1YYV3_9HYPH|nr:DUF1127 domain-containing protein [Hoeflea olei]OCW58744.1 hypothetical protein AWJ14_00520 [Hoeflea olei]
MTSETRPTALPLCQQTSQEGAARPEAGFAAGARVVWSLGRWLARACDRRRQRLHLGELDDHLLKDIGVSRREARREASRWFFS